MPPRRTHYETLGVERSATPEEIKARYRRLVKRYHPDVASVDRAAAHRAFVQITEAYQVLIDPGKRESYDRELRLRAAEQARLCTTTAAPTGAPGWARTPPRTDVGQLFFNAQMDYSRGRFVQALSVCQQVLRHDPRHAGAHSLMGDIFRARGRTDEAIRMYTMAVQLDPDSRSDLEKLERLVRRGRQTTAMPRGRLPAAQRLVAALGCLLFAALTFLPAALPGERAFPGFVLLSEWTDVLLICMAGAGLTAGFIATLLGIVRHLEDDFLLAPIRTAGGPLPVGVLVSVVSLMFFPLALLFYLLIAAVQEAASPAMLRVLLLSGGTVLLFALVPLPQGADWQTLLFGGNVVFPCTVLGCFTAGLWREPW